jgi:hypothetical protein
LLQLEQRCVVDAGLMSRYDRQLAHLAGLVGPAAAVQRDDPEPGDLAVGWPVVRHPGQVRGSLPVQSDADVGLRLADAGILAGPPEFFPGRPREGVLGGLGKDLLGTGDGAPQAERGP